MITSTRQVAQAMIAGGASGPQIHFYGQGLLRFGLHGDHCTIVSERFTTQFAGIYKSGLLKSRVETLFLAIESSQAIWCNEFMSCVFG